MQILKPGGDLQLFFDRLATAKHRALLLDYDGTLAPFRPERNQAEPYQGIREILNEIIINDHSQVVIITGRAIADLIPLLRLKKLPEIWGSHGFERRFSDGSYQKKNLEKRQIRGLKDAVNWIKTEGLKDRCEQKPASVALHWRGMSDNNIKTFRTQILDKWNVIAYKSSLIVSEFDGGLELRTEANKGIAVTTILSELGPSTIMAYLGDDFTDEDAFQALGDKGLGVFVRPDYRPTKAHLWLIPPQELLEFLTQWNEVCQEHP
jgi:trehalose 6-phosphate phosphatase